MMGFRRRVLLVATLLARCGATAGAVPTGAMVDVSANGTTHLARTFGRVRVAVEIKGHSLPVDPSHARYQPRDARCTGGRNPCMLVDLLTIHVNGDFVDVPRSVTIDLSDVNRAGLSTVARGTYKLLIEGGDASEAYTTVILFDGKRVKQRDVIADEAGMLAERTVYRNLSHAFDN